MAERLGDKAFSGMAWTGLERVATTFGRVAVGIAMARLLEPADYGLVGMLAVLVAFGNVFVDSGFSAALIQRKTRDERYWSTAFFSNIAIAVASYGTLFVAAPAIAAFYGEPSLTPIMRVLSVLLLVSGACAAPATRLMADLRFRAQTLGALVSLVCAASVGLTLAWKGAGPWALVGQMVSGSLSGGAMIWLMARWVPRRWFSRIAFRDLFGFGSRHLGASLINAVYGNMYPLIAGKAYGAVDVGYLGRAENFSAVPAEVVTSTVSKVGYPVLSKLQDEPKRFSAACAKLAVRPLFVLMPVLAGIAAAAEPVVAVLLGERWLECAPLVKVLCLGAVFAPLAALNRDMLYAMGRSDAVLRLEFFKKPIGLAMMIVAVPFGLMGLCVAKSLCTLVEYVFNGFWAGRLTGYSLTAQIHDILPVMAYGAAAYVAAAAVCGIQAPQTVRFAAGLAAAGVSYLAVAAVARDGALAEIAARIRDRVVRR